MHSTCLQLKWVDLIMKQLILMLNSEEISTKKNSKYPQANLETEVPTSDAIFLCERIPFGGKKWQSPKFLQRWHNFSLSSISEPKRELTLEIMPRIEQICRAVWALKPENPKFMSVYSRVDSILMQNWVFQENGLIKSSSIIRNLM